MFKASTILPFLSLNNFILIGVIFLNPWIWKIIRDNLLLGIVLIILTFLLVRLITKKDFNVVIISAVSLLFLILSFVILKSNFDKNIFIFTPDDNVKLNSRHFYYSNELGKLFLNSKVLNYYKNYSLPIRKIEDNLFSNLDLNLYFFASAPRERSGVIEFEKYSSLFLPFFSIGALLITFKGSKYALFYLIIATFLSAFISQRFTLGPILLFPLVSISIAIGIDYVLNNVKQLRI